MTKIAILGSSRSNGNTKTALDFIIGNSIEIIDLNNFNINYYNYNNVYQNDDFINIIEKAIVHKTIIIATPVYWYTMSAIMKTFFDRFADLLSIRKNLAKQLCGKKLFVVSSFGSNKPIGFEDVFIQTCEYMDMIYLGTSFIHIKFGYKDINDIIEENASEINKAKKILNI